VNVLFAIPIAVRFLHFKNTDKKSRFPLSLFPSNQMRKRVSKLPNENGTDPIKPFPKNLFW
jgi:hypothetical protein